MYILTFFYTEKLQQLWCCFWWITPRRQIATASPAGRSAVGGMKTHKFCCYFLCKNSQLKHIFGFNASIFHFIDSAFLRFPQVENVLHHRCCTVLFCCWGKGKGLSLLLSHQQLQRKNLTFFFWLFCCKNFAFA